MEDDSEDDIIEDDLEPPKLGKRDRNAVQEAPRTRQVRNYTIAYCATNNNSGRRRNRKAKVPRQVVWGKIFYVVMMAYTYI